MKQNVHKREVFYLAGYDPRGARYYYNLYKDEAILQAKVNSTSIDISSRKRMNKHMIKWNIEHYDNEVKTETNYHYLIWDDIIRKRWKQSIFALFIDLIFYFRTYILAGLFIKYSKVSPRQMFGIFYPIVYLTLALYLSYLSASYTFTFIMSYLSLEATLLLASLLGLGIFYLFILLGNRMALFWLVRIFVFSAKYVLEEMRDLDERIDIFANHLAHKIERAKENEIDEILIVAHSVGAIISMPILSKALAQLTIDEENRPIISVLILGECIPLVSGIPQSKKYQEHMQYLASQSHINWLDYTTVIDGACFPYLNYFEDSNITIKEKENFHFLSARFHLLFSKERYRQLRKNRYLTHFAYLMSTEFSGGYDFFQMTAGKHYLNAYFPQKKEL